MQARRGKELRLWIRQYVALPLEEDEMGGRAGLLLWLWLWLLLLLWLWLWLWWAPRTGARGAVAPRGVGEGADASLEGTVDPADGREKLYSCMTDASQPGTTGVVFVVPVAPVLVTAAGDGVKLQNGASSVPGGFPRPVVVSPACVCVGSSGFSTTVVPRG